jgi:hypothetical protein
MAIRDIRLGVVCALIVVACGGGTLTELEYADQVEDLVARMEAGFDNLDSEWESQPPTLDGAGEYWDGRLEIRDEFLEGVSELTPPDQIAGMHTTALDLFTRITAADEAIAARVATFDSISEHRQWLDTPEGAASLAILDEVFEFCRSSQADFDATEERAALSDDAWIPSDMKQVIKVAFGCPESP